MTFGGIRSVSLYVYPSSHNNVIAGTCRLGDICHQTMQGTVNGDKQLRKSLIPIRSPTEMRIGRRSHFSLGLTAIYFINASTSNTVLCSRLVCF